MGKVLERRLLLRRLGAGPFEARELAGHGVLLQDADTVAKVLGLLKYKRQVHFKESIIFKLAGRFAYLVNGVL